MKRFLITTTPILDGYKVKSYLGVVNLNIVLGVNFFSDFAASFTDVFGGNSETYQGKMDQMYDEAKSGLEKKAKQLGGNAIVGFNIDFDEISGKGKSMFMLSASGTACIVETGQIDSFETKDTERIFQDTISLEMQKERIVNSIKEKSALFTESDWNYMIENPSLEIAELLVSNTYPKSYHDEVKAKIEYIVSQLDYADACKIVYPYYMNPYTIKDYYGEIRDLSTNYIPLLKKCKLFNPEQISALIDTDLRKAIEILDCEKSYYDSTDLKYMQEICDKLNNLPDLGKIEVGKDGIFSKEKELFICRNNHKNDKDVEFCKECNENIKGVTKEDKEKFELFKKRTEILSRLLSEE